MNILIVFTFGYSLKIWRNSNILERELSIYKDINEKFGTKFTFLTFGDSSDVELITEKENFSVIPIYDYLKKPKTKLLSFLQSFIVPFKLKNQFKDVSLIKQHQILGVWISIILKILLKKPLIVRTGYDMHAFAKQENKKKHIQLLYFLLNQIGLFFAEIFTVSNTNDLQNKKEKYLANSNIELRTNWIFKSRYNDFEERHEDAVVCVGRLEYQKNYFELFENFKDLDIEIHIYGVGSLEHEINEYIKKNNKNIKLMGTVNNENLNNELRKYRFFVTSSLFEGNPKSVMEAMAAGCVIFASNISNHQDLITHNKNGFLFELGSDNLNQLFKKHFRSPDYLSEISRNAYDIANEKFELNILSKIEYEDYLSVIKPA